MISTKPVFFGDQILLLKDGRVVQQGGLAELTNSPAEPFVEQFIRAQRSVLETRRDRGGRPVRSLGILLFSLFSLVPAWCFFVGVCR